MDVITRTCDRCARFAEDCTVIEDTYICGDCRAEIAADEAEVESLRQQLRGAVVLDDAAVGRATTALLEDSGLPPYGNYRATIERRVRLAFAAAGGQ